MVHGMDVGLRLETQPEFCYWLCCDLLCDLSCSLDLSESQKSPYKAEECELGVLSTLLPGWQAVTRPWMEAAQRMRWWTSQVGFLSPLT